MVDKNLIAELEKQRLKAEDAGKLPPLSRWTGLTEHEVNMVKDVEAKHGRAKADEIRRSYLFSLDTEPVQYVNYLLEVEPEVLSQTDRDYIN